MPINVNLTPLLEEMVRQKVKSGLYTSASEVIREALRLMGEQDSILSIPDGINTTRTLNRTLKSHHSIIHGDSRQMNLLADRAVHLVVTLPPYWQLRTTGRRSRAVFTRVTKATSTI